MAAPAPQNPPLLEADRALWEASKALRLVRAVRPTNEAEEKAAFLSGSRANPRFRYRPTSPVNLPVALEEIVIPGGRVGAVLERQRRLLLKVKAALEHFSPGSLRDISREVYGAPHPSLLSIARRILTEVPADPPTFEELPVIKRRLELALTEYGLSGWSVVYADGDYTAARPLEKKVLLTNLGPLPAGTGERLAVHEVGVHAVRANNGAAQPLRIMEYGLPGYERTEEGLAVYAELLTGTMSRRTLRNYAARALAVGGMEKGWDFARTHQELCELGQTPELAWETALRAHRGGGLVKDHIYLEGLLDIIRFVRNGGELRPLFVGKIGLSHLELAADLLRQRALAPPMLTPAFLDRSYPTGPVAKLLWSFV